MHVIPFGSKGKKAPEVTVKLLSGKKILFRVAPVPNHSSLPSVIYYTWRGLFSEFYGICIFDKKVTPRSSLIHSGEKASECGVPGF